MRVIDSEEGPAPVEDAPYSQAIVSNGLVFVTGQIGIDPATMQLVPGGLAAQTERAIKNVRAILRAAGSDLDRMVKVNVYLSDFNNWSAMNRIYADHVGKPYPARATVQVGLPPGALVEIEVIAEA